MKDSTKWNEVIHQVNERTNESDWQWKQDEMKKKNIGTHSWMTNDKRWIRSLLHDDYDKNMIFRMVD